MGVVYTPEQFRLGKIPTREGLTRAGEMVLGLFGPNTNMSIDGVTTVLVHGSVPEGRHNRRSDLDVYVSYDSSMYPSAEGLIMEGIRRVTNETSAAVEAVLVPSNWPTALLEQVMYDPLFNIHLVKAMDDMQWCVGDIDKRLTELIPDQSDHDLMKNILINYFVYKRGGFVKATKESFTGDSSQCATLQRALELPKSTFRKMQQALGVKVVELGVSSFGDFLKECVNLGYISDRESVALRLLKNNDDEYTMFIEEEHDQSPDFRAELHRELLEQIYQPSISMASEATRGIAEHIDSSRV